MNDSPRPRAAAANLRPYVPADQRVPEFTLRAVVLGTVLSFAFGMVNAYLGLKVGLTTSASIPAAVLSMAVLRGLLRRGTILENNVVQTIASAGDSLAAGVVFTVHAPEGARHEPPLKPPGLTNVVGVGWQWPRDARHAPS